MSVYLARIAYPVTALGPGRRLALWTAGCGRRCSGCISPEILVAHPEHHIAVEAVVARVAAVGAGLEGITLSGGDPLDQPEAIAALVTGIRTHFPKWNVMAYTGHSLAYLKANLRYVEALRSIDLLIDGPYRRELPCPHPLLGSENQCFHPLSAVGNAMLERIEAENGVKPHFNLARHCGQEALLVGIGTQHSRRRTHHTLGLPQTTHCFYTENQSRYASTLVRSSDET